VIRQAALYCREVTPTADAFVAVADQVAPTTPEQRTCIAENVASLPPETASAMLDDALNPAANDPQLESTFNGIYSDCGVALAR